MYNAPRDRFRIATGQHDARHAGHDVGRAKLAHPAYRSLDHMSARPLPISHALQSAVLRQQREAELRVVKECPHHHFVAHETSGAVWDDHTAELGQCLACDAWIARVTWKSHGIVEDRLMTEREKDALAKAEDRRRGNEWADDQAAGGR